MCKAKRETSQCEHVFNEANKRLVLHVRLGCGSLSITTQNLMSLLANELDVRSVNHFLSFMGLCTVGNI